MEQRRLTVFRQAKTLQSGLLALLDRVDKVREEHDKLEGENRFLQEYDHHQAPPLFTSIKKLVDNNLRGGFFYTNFTVIVRYIGSLMATSKITGDSGRNRNSSSRLK